MPYAQVAAAYACEVCTDLGQTTLRVNRVLTQSTPIPSFLVKERDKADASSIKGGTGAYCIRTGLTGDIF